MVIFLQYDESLGEYVKDKLEGSSTTGSEKKVKEVSDLSEDDNEKKLTKMKHFKGGSEPDESERGSESSTSTNNKKYGSIQFTLLCNTLFSLLFSCCLRVHSLHVLIYSYLKLFEYLVYTHTYIYKYI